MKKMNHNQVFRLELNLRFVIFRWLWLLISLLSLIILPPLSLYLNIDLPLFSNYLIPILLIAGILNIFFFIQSIYLEITLNRRLLLLLSTLQIIFDLILASFILFFTSGGSFAFVFFLLPIIETAILFNFWITILTVAFSSFSTFFIYLALNNNYFKIGYRPEIVFDNPYLYHNLISWNILFVFVAFFISYFYESIKPSYLIKRRLLKKKEDNCKITEEMFKEFSEQEGQKINTKLSKLNRILYSKNLEIKMIKQELNNLDEAKAKFISVTTHQMRTPLSAIKWTLDMVLKNQLGEINETQREFLQKGFDSTQRMIIIVNNLLNLNQSESLRDDYSFSSVQIEEILKQVIKEFNNQLKSKNIKLILKEPDNKLPLIELDQTKMIMVLENLLDNAIKYTPQQGRISIIIDDKNINTATPKVEIIIKDTGIGIPNNEQGKIFHRFFRASNAVLQEPDGSGVGLFISKDIVEKHGGTIWFNSVKEKGTTFHLLLPLNQVKSSKGSKLKKI